MDRIELTAAAQIERSKLQRHFRRYDIFFFLVCTIVGVDTIASVAASGGEAFTWLVIFGVVFFVPQAMIFAELGTAFPQEGGEYLWTRMAFGHLAGAVNNFYYWVTNPVWIGGTLAISAVTAVAVFFDGGRSSLPPVAFYVVGLVFVWATVLGAIMSFSYGKWLPTAGAFARFLLLGLFSVSVVIYAAEHGLHGLGVGSYRPTGTGFVALIGVLLFNYVGSELPSAAGEEMTNPRRDVPFAIFRSALLSFVLYALPILGILVVLPASSVSNFGGFVDAIHAVFTVYGGSVHAGVSHLAGAGAVLGAVAAILFIVCVMTSGATWIMGSDRSLAVSGYDGAGPRSLGVISERFGTPVRVNVLSGIVSTVVLVLAHQITNGSAAKYFSAVLGVTISTTLISYLLIYPALWKLRVDRPDAPRPWRMPAARPLTVLVMGLLVISVLQLVAPGAPFNWFGADFRPSGWTYGQRGTYLLTEAIPLLIFGFVGFCFYLAGARTRGEVVEVPADPDDEGFGMLAPEAG